MKSIPRSKQNRQKTILCRTARPNLVPRVSLLSLPCQRQRRQRRETLALGKRLGTSPFRLDTPPPPPEEDALNLVCSDLGLI